MGKSRKENTLVDNEKKEKCITPKKTWELIEQRRKTKKKILTTKSARLKDQLKERYSIAIQDKEIKKVHGRRDFVDRIEQDAEEAASKEDMGTISQNMVRSIVDVTFA